LGTHQVLNHSNPKNNEDMRLELERPKFLKIVHSFLKLRGSRPLPQVINWQKFTSKRKAAQIQE
jgi:hypothetical protein